MCASSSGSRLVMGPSSVALSALEDVVEIMSECAAGGKRAVTAALASRTVVVLEIGRESVRGSPRPAKVVRRMLTS